MKTVFFAFALMCLVLTSCKPTQTDFKKATSLEGSWELNYITGPRITFDGLYPDKKPIIIFDLKANRVSGNNSCNQYFGVLILDGNKINFKDAKMGMTMMACPGLGETTYMKTLEKIDSYSISEDGKTLNFIMGDIAMMRFEKVATDAHNSQNALDWPGTYKGITPCADCEGIAIKISLNKDLTFLIQTNYLGKGDGKIFEEKGNFTWDKTGGIVLLQGTKGKPSPYKVGENKLVQLDLKGKEISGLLAEKYVLVKE
jgi:heat shock protein HslJ